MTKQKTPHADIEMLDRSHIFRAVRLVLDVLIEEGSLPLTASGAFKRDVVIWAVSYFDWPYHDAEDFLEAKRAPREADFRPLSLVHKLLEDLKLGVRRSNRFAFTDLGAHLRFAPQELFNVLISHFLQHERNPVLEAKKLETGIDWNWTGVIEVIDRKIAPPFDRDILSSALFGDNFLSDRHHFHAKMEARIGILRPLFWAGVLKEVQDSDGSFVHEVFEKSELWPALLSLRDNGMLR
jgi:hypothetical protein